MTNPVYDQLAIALQDIRTRLGETAFTDQRRLSSLLLDVAPEARREIRVIATAIGEGVPAALKSAERSLLGIEIDRQASRLESATGLQRELALQTVRVLSFAMDLGPLPSVYQGSAPIAPAQDAWAGLSQPVQPQERAPIYTPPPPGPKSGGFLDKLPFPKQYLYIGAGVLAAVIVGVSMLPKGPAAPPQDIVVGGDKGTLPPVNPNPQPDPNQPPVDNPPVTNDPAKENAPPPGPAPKVQPSNYAEELADFNVPSKRTLEQNVGSPTPLTIPVGKRITTTELQALLGQDRSVLLVDVLDGQHPQTLRGAIYFPEAGYPGSTNDGVQSQVANQLRQVAGGNVQRPIVFFCQGARCWESYNAVLRASAAGYRNIYWYRGGLVSWQAAGGPTQPLNSGGGQNNYFR